jgi:Fe-S oxidoreductase
VITDAAEAATLWRIREDGAGLSGTSPAGRPAHAGWEDAAVPPHRLGAYLREFDALMDEHGLTGMPYGHFGDGCVHVRIDFPLDTGTTTFETFVTRAARLVAAHGGSMSGEHGDGRARGALLPLMYSERVIAAFEAVKDVFDPDDVLNPGVIVRPRPFTTDLRRPAAKEAAKEAAEEGDFTTAVHRCTGVGKCTADTGGVMCPSYLATRDEKDSTRGRARVLQEMVNGTLVTGGWRAPEVEESLDLCLACKGCASDCPAGVDMATWKAEVLHRRYRRRPRPRTHYSLGWLPRWARLAAIAPGPANRLAGTWIAKRVAGIDPRRPLPRFTRRARVRPSTGTGDPVVLWIDTFTEHFAPQVAAAAVRVLEAAGFAVLTPSQRVCCGLTFTSTGQFGAARRRLRRGLAALSEMAPAGVEVVGLEPSCVASMRDDARTVLDRDDPVLEVAGRVRTLAELLTARGFEPGRTDRHVLAQPHCHHHAVLGWDADRALLERTGATVTRVPGCCGLAGNFGMDHYDVSVAVARTHLLPAVAGAFADGADADLLADGFSCRTQLDHLTGRRARHLAELLADLL